MELNSLAITRQAFEGWISSITAVFIRGLHERVSRGGSNILAILEPIALILIISGGRYALGSITPMYGSSSVLFFATGILPHYMFIWVSARVSSTHLDQTPFPRINALDRVIAIAAIEFLTLFVATILVLSGLWFWGVPEAMPYDIAGLLILCLTLFAFGIGMGLINAVIGTFIPIWRGIYHAVIRGAMLISGLFFIPDFMIPSVRQWLAWNPLLHSVTWFRYCFYRHYPVLILDKGFLISVTFITLVIGLALERALRRQRAFA